MQKKSAPEIKSFSDLNLHESLKLALNETNYKNPTPIQAKTLPLSMKGFDVLGVAQTGTGKTAAFALPLLQYLMVNPVHPKEKGPWAIVLAPTRELAIQIKLEINKLSTYTGLNSAALYGGTPIEQQKELLKSSKIDIVVGTPGRIIDLYKQKILRLKNIDVCVLDEADRMFDLGFIDDVRYLLKQMPSAEKRLNLLFSATMPQKVKELAYEYFNAPEIVNTETADLTVDNVEEILFHTANFEKTPLLIGLLEKEKPQRSMIFLNTKKDIERLSIILKTNGYKNAALSGDVAQNKREAVIKDFQSGKINIVIATDVAARGLHIDNVSHVFNYDLPQAAEDYVHRIGRTARAGASGKAISFACEQYVYSLPEIEHYIGHKIHVEPIDEDLLADVIPMTEEDIKTLNESEQKKRNSHRNNNRKPNNQQNRNNRGRKPKSSFNS